MRKLLLVLAVLVPGFARAEMTGQFSINVDNNEARLLMTETSEDGTLSKWFDMTKATETDSPTFIRTKRFEMTNHRFRFVCNKVISATAPPSTSCTFVIKTGENSFDLRTLISLDGQEKIAVLTMSKMFSKELVGIFPETAEGGISFILASKDGASVRAFGRSDDRLALGFRVEPKVDPK